MDSPRTAPSPAAPPASPVARITPAEFAVLLRDQHPFSAVLGIEVTEIGPGTARAILPPRPTHQRLGGVVAGPMLMSLADLVTYAAVVGATGEPGAVTTSLTINFLRGSPAGAIVADARLLKVGRLCVGEATLHAPDDDTPLAHVVSTWSVPRS